MDIIVQYQYPSWQAQLGKCTISTADLFTMKTLLPDGLRMVYTNGEEVDLSMITDYVMPTSFNN